MDQAPDKQQGFRASTGIPRVSRLPAPRKNGQASIGQSSLPRALRPTVSSLARSNSPEKKPSQYSDPVQVQEASSSGLSDDLSGSLKSDVLIERPSTSGGTTTAVGREGLELTSNSAPATKRRTRPSLSDRTIETLSRITPSPSPGRRRSGFFSADSPMRAPSRPASSMSVTRKNTGQTCRPPSPSKQPRVPPVPSIPQNHGSADRKATTRTSLSTAASMKASRGGLTNTIPNPRSSSPTKGTSATVRARPQSSFGKHDSRVSVDSKTVNSKFTKQKPSLASTFTPLSSSEANGKLPPSGRLNMKTDTSTRANRRASNQPKSVLALTPPSKSSTGSPKSPLSPPTRIGGESISDIRKSSTSSKALRDTIAKAKAQAAKSRRASSQNRGFEDAFHPDSETDPFSQLPKGGSNKGLLRKRVVAGRTSGILNIAGMDFSQIPDEVMKMYEFDPNAAGSGWAESVDLVKLVAADNRFEELREDAFPDVEIGDGDEEQNFQFRGLEILDLHGNALKALPAGLSRLDRLHTLNLSSNSLEMSSLNEICQLSALKELYLSNNSLSGPLTSDISRLANLHVLELKDNNLTSLCDLSNLSDLKVLNVASNKLTFLPFDVLASLSLIELVAYKNKLSGTLCLGKSFPTLQTLDLSCNAFTSISTSSSPSSSSPLLPVLQILSLSTNRLTCLPPLDVLAPDLISLHLSENALSSLPQAFTSLAKLKNANLRGNDIRVLDIGITKMEELKGLDVAANPLRERKLLAVAGDVVEIKRELGRRLELGVEGGERKNAEEGNDGYMAERRGVAERENRKEPEGSGGGNSVGAGTDAGGTGIGPIRKSNPNPKPKPRKEDHHAPSWLGGWEE